MEYTKGQRVRHPKMEGWGVGEVLEDSRNGVARIFFVGAGEKSLRLDYVAPVLVTGDEASHELLDNLRIKSSKTLEKYKSLPDSIETFLSQFPGGFYGEKFYDEERGYKEKASALARETLSEGALNPGIQQEDYAELCRSAMRVIAATNLVFPNEKMALKDGLQSRANQQLFVERLYALLYGEEGLSSRFEAFCRCLETLGAAKWTTATYFPFLVHSETSMFIKPTITQHAAEICRFEINYQPQLNWLTYKSVLDFSNTIKVEIAELEPRDMIDVQSFMWCISPH
ncbi:DUF3553 domain-containing protein [Halomonas sp. G15]|uniref:DUF3553 domain-containing protein n=1 Tax=Halomonas sp. G15 TaxID=2903521 RepID=UPI001E5F89D8|nr:DUF3553 domain-containing protein [Halomonas sp. G15]MCE0733633.1 DUF3553 domain-containing protein [Halomonas sp. G15]